MRTVLPILLGLLLGMPGLVIAQDVAGDDDDSAGAVDEPTISELMAVLIVDRLEVVDVCQQQGQPDSVSLVVSVLELQQLVTGRIVEQAGQTVAHG